MKILAVNAGSTSLKAQLVAVEGARVRVLAVGTVSGLGERAQVRSGPESAPDAAEEVQARSIEEALDHLLPRLTAAQRRASGGRSERVEGIGHRVVHGGGRFPGPTPLSAAVLRAVAELEALAPLHNAPALAGIRAAAAAFPGVPAVAVFDTSFFHDLPERAAAYAIPRALAERHGIRRFGFHGISHAYLAERYAEIAAAGGRQGLGRIVTLHLGGGCSAAAIRGGCPVDTSMGFTPLEGLVMATRSGDLDPALVGFLARRESAGVEEVEDWLNRRSGLRGLSGRTGDLRALLDAEREGDPAATLAVEVFCYRARKYVGAYLAALGGAEAVVFSGAIGERAPEIRARVCAGLEWAGVRLDPDRNAAAVGVEASVGADGSAVAVHVIPTREELAIARATARCLAP